jgi:hypothetical protein
MENPFAEKIASLNIPNYGKLSFEEQCAYHAALMLDVPVTVVMSVAGVSSATASHLAAAGQVRSGILRYPKVAAELAKLGREAFVHRYLTPIVRERLDQGLDAFNRKKRNPDLNSHGWNPRANGYCRRFDWPETSIGLHAIFTIQAVPDLEGYAWRNLKPRQDLPPIAVDQAKPQGDPERGGLGFPTSQDCFRWVKNYLDPKQ